MGDTLQVTFHYQLSILHLKSAWGGPNGGTLTLSSQNLNKLAPVACGPMLLPPQVTLAPYQQWSVSFLCEGEVASTAENDIVVEGVLAETGTDESVSSRAELTAMQIELRPQFLAPQNRALFRHTYGIGEVVRFKAYPVLPQTILSVQGGSTKPDENSHLITWGVSNVVHDLSVMLKGVVYHPSIHVLVPSKIEGFDVQYEVVGELPDNQACGIFLLQKFRVHPLTVSFIGIAVEEVPCTEELVPDEYFRHLLQNEPFSSSFHRSHTREAGAGTWYDVEEGNVVGGNTTVDRTGFQGFWPRMMPNGTLTMNPLYGWLGGGAMVWKNPFGWNVHQPPKSSVNPVGVFAEDVRQTFRVSAGGTVSIHKLGHVAERTLGGSCRVYDEPGAGGDTN